MALTNAMGTVVVILYIDKLGRRFILLRLIPFIAMTLLILALGLGLNGLSTGETFQSKWFIPINSCRLWQMDQFSGNSAISSVLLHLIGSNPLDG